MAGPGQVKSGRYIRWYANGLAVGLTRMSSVKPEKSTKLEAVKEAGNPDLVEYVKGIPETSLSLTYNVIHYGQLAIAMGQTIGVGALASTSAASGEVPDIPDNFDLVERMIVPGTEGTNNEQYQGFVLYQQVQVNKDAWDPEVDKLYSVNLSANCRTPRRFINVNGLQADRFTGNGVQTAFVLTNKVPRPLKDGYYTIRVEAPYSTVLRETVDYTVASTTSTTTLNFATAPASSTVPNVLAWYAY
jgi:hypothetical protein